MGLDMYLYKRNYVQNWPHMAQSERHEITVKKGGETVQHIKPERISYIIEQVGYWRKANAIHNWFVRNVQNDLDECQQAYVDHKQLQALLDAVNTILDAPAETQKSLAAELLPTQSGFFFGSTDYDENYLEDLTLTKEILSDVLSEEHDDEGFYYQSSW